MRFPGAAIGPDAVLVWTGDRELTRFERDGARASFTVPFTPLAAHIGPDDMVAVDDRGSIHTFSLTGEHQGFVPLRESPGTIEQAAVSESGEVLAILAGEVQLFMHGLMLPWSFDHRRYEAARETAVIALSKNGGGVLVRFETASSSENLGGTMQGIVLGRQDGKAIYRHIARELPPMELALSPNASLIAFCEHGNQVRIDEVEHMAMVHRVEPAGQVQSFRFRENTLGVLFDYTFVVVHDGGIRETRIALPEQFDDFVFSGDEVVCIHPELGAWWIKTAAAD